MIFQPQTVLNTKTGGEHSIFVFFQNPFGIFLISLIVDEKNLDLSVLRKKVSIAHSYYHSTNENVQKFQNRMF